MDYPQQVGGLSVAARLDRLPMTSLHKRFTAIMALGTFFEIYELFLSGVLATTLKKTFTLHGLELSLVLASAFVGAFIGAVVIGRMADRVGRRSAYMLTLSLYSAATLACAFAPNVWTLVLFRFIAGIGLGGELPVTDSFLGDILPPERRGRYAAWAFTAAYLAVPVVGYLGMTLVGTTPLGIAGWRWMFGFGALGAVLTFLARRGLPESPRWLESVGRSKEADAITARLEAAAQQEGWTPPASEPVTAAASAPVQKLPITSLFREPFTRRTILMAILWVLAPVGYYGFSSLATLALAAKGFTVSSSLTYLTFSFIGYPLGSFLSVLVMDKYERKWILCAAFTAMALTGMAYGNATTTAAIIISGFCFTMVANVMSNAGHIYQLEQYPTGVRTTATGWLYSLSRLSTAAAPFYLIPLLDSYGAAAVFTLVAVVMLAAAFAMTFGVKTTGLSVDAIADPNTQISPEVSARSTALPLSTPETP
ncbi:MFS transporter [Nocardia sp. NPDC005998]|uniref:MFS transporter n=1 Tax=Nocardia sp. NPDC005998 TaxID=3156894 RepID=UPI0033A52764